MGTNIPAFIQGLWHPQTHCCLHRRPPHLLHSREQRPQLNAVGRLTTCISSSSSILAPSTRRHCGCLCRRLSVTLRFKQSVLLASRTRCRTEQAYAGHRNADYTRHKQRLVVIPIWVKRVFIRFRIRHHSPQLGCAHAQPKRGAMNRL